MVTFADLGLRLEIIRAIEDLGFEKPTPIQEKTIPFILSSDRDVLAFAQTGTGKTAAFGLPMLHRIDTNTKIIQALVLCPTRELCLQITKDMENYSKYLQTKIIPVYGGSSIEKQIEDLRRGGQVVVGTPGRIMDLIKRKKLNFSQIKHLVLDEADEMLTMGFKDDLDAILAQVSKDAQTLLFSATMPREVISIAEKYMHDPEQISVGERNQGAKNVSHYYYMVQAKDRYEALKRITDMHPNIYGIIFCRTRNEARDIAQNLMQEGYNADAIHGDLSQAQRDQVMGRFRTKQLQILVATDVAARGIDVDDLTHVINYNLPDDVEVYTHRSGRTGRAGKSGISIAIIHSRELSKINLIEKKIGKKFERSLVPTGREICESQLLNLVDKIETMQVDESEIQNYLPEISQKLADLSREDLLKRLISIEFNRFLAYYKDADDLNVNPKREKATQQRKGKVEFCRFFINLGTKNQLTIPGLIELINSQGNLRRAQIGKIEVLKSFSFFEIEGEYEDEVMQVLNQTDYQGVRVQVEPSKNKDRAQTQYSEKRYFDKDKKDKSYSGGARKRKKRKPAY